jgi:hypothetical protein
MQVRIVSPIYITSLTWVVAAKLCDLCLVTMH